MNIVVPMAGAGKRFKEAGYTFPKPLIEIHSKPMIQKVVENLNIVGRHIFLVQKQDYDKYAFQYLLPLISPGCEIIPIDGITEGAACTTLLAKHYIDNDTPLIIANSDQLVEFFQENWVNEFKNDGGMLTFESVHPKWSFAKVDTNGFVIEVAEKKPISNVATVGIYYWAKGSDYVKYAENMIAKNKRVNNEFYVCPVFNEAINDGKNIKIVPIKKMWGLGTPEDLRYYLTYYKG